MRQYFLTKHAFACLCGDHVVLLDLKRDRYLAIDAARARDLHDIVAGWPAVPATSDSNSATAEPVSQTSAKLTATLIERGLLTPDRSLGKEASLPEIAAASDSVISDEDETAAHRRHWRDAVTITLSVAEAAFNLRYRPISWVVADVHRRRRRAVDAGGVRSTDTTALRSVANTFHRGRAYLYGTHNACMLDSLALMYFLVRRGFQPQWVIGVRTLPSFTAHCWLQDRVTVLNDTVEHTADYMPIMVV